jgi:hypothetical protein
MAYELIQSVRRHLFHVQKEHLENKVKELVNYFIVNDFLAEMFHFWKVKKQEGNLISVFYHYINLIFT